MQSSSLSEEFYVSLIIIRIKITKFMDISNNKKNIITLVLISLYIVLIAVSKLFPHPDNFTPILGLAIFGGAMFIRKRIFLYITVFALFVSDFIFNNYVHPEYFTNKSGIIIFSDYMIWVYVSILLVIVAASYILKKFNYPKLFFTAIGGAIVFFLITNFGSWLSSPELYTRDFTGLINSYVAGIPFFRSTLISNILFSFIVFGIYDIAVRYIFKEKGIFSFMDK